MGFFVLNQSQHINYIFPNSIFIGKLGVFILKCFKSDTGEGTIKQGEAKWIALQ